MGLEAETTRRCKGCGSDPLTFPKRDWITRDNNLFCDEQCVENYQHMDLMERAQRACFALPAYPYEYEDYYMHVHPDTWDDLLAYKDELIGKGELPSIGLGVWRSFWGFKICPSIEMTKGEFEVRLKKKTRSN
jgi:hypothetical protein